METVIGCADSSQIACGEKQKNKMLRNPTKENECLQKNKNVREFFTKSLFGKFVATKFPNHRYTYFTGKLKFVLHFRRDELSYEFTLFI